MNKSQIYSVNWPDVRNVHIQAEALHVFIANQSRDATEEFVGSGQRTHHPERTIPQQQAKKEEEEFSQKNLHILMAQIQDHVRDLEIKLAELKAEMKQLLKIQSKIETDLGGLDKMGQEVGTLRLPGEDNETYRKRLKEDIDRKIKTGEIAPASMLAQWSTNRDYISFNLDHQAAVIDETNRLQRAAATKDPALMQQALDGATTAGLYQYETISDNEAIDRELDDRFIQTDVDAEVVDKDVREYSADNLMASRLKGNFITAHDGAAPVQEPEQSADQLDTGNPGIKPTNG